MKKWVNNGNKANHWEGGKDRYQMAKGIKESDYGREEHYLHGVSAYL